MSRRFFFILLGIALLAVAPSGLADEKKPAGNVSELRVRFRLNAIESEILLDEYAAGIKRELNLRDGVRSLIRNKDERLADYKKTLQEAQDDLESIKKRLIVLEMEKVDLVERLGPKVVAEESANVERFDTRLKMMERRLNAVERQR